MKSCPTYTISFNKITPQICNNLISFIKTLSLLACGVDNLSSLLFLRLRKNCTDKNLPIKRAVKLKL